jgi:hypothetical protein
LQIASGRTRAKLDVVASLGCGIGRTFFWARQKPLLSAAFCAPRLREVSMKRAYIDLASQCPWRGPWCAFAAPALGGQRPVMPTHGRARLRARCPIRPPKSLCIVSSFAHRSSGACATIPQRRLVHWPPGRRLLSPHRKRRRLPMHTRSWPVVGSEASPREGRRCVIPPADVL